MIGLTALADFPPRTKGRSRAPPPSEVREMVTARPRARLRVDPRGRERPAAVGVHAHALKRSASIGIATALLCLVLRDRLGMTLAPGAPVFGSALAAPRRQAATHPRVREERRCRQVAIAVSAAFRRHSRAPDDIASPNSSSGHSPPLRGGLQTLSPQTAWLSRTASLFRGEAGSVRTQRSTQRFQERPPLMPPPPSRTDSAAGARRQG